jgi:flagellar export protein FliJ
MKKQFRLEKLLEIRVMDERSAAAKLSDIDARLNRVQDELDRIAKKQTQLYAEFVNSIQTPGTLAPLQAHLSELKEEALFLEKSLENIKKEKAGAFALYEDALKKRKILENLKEKTLT